MKQKELSGQAWTLDRLKKSQEPWEKKYKKKSRGLAYSSSETRRRVARLGGKASRRRR